MKKGLFIIGAFSYLILLLLSLIFFKERTVIFDASYQLFCILRDGDFAIQVNRYGAALTQVFPLVASKLGLSLEMVARLYSSSFIILYFSIFLLLWLWLKNHSLAIVLLLFNTLIVTHSFYWVQCELVQGVALTLLYIGMIEREIQRDKLSLLFIASTPFLLLTIVFFYPLLVFVLLFALAFLFLHYRKSSKLLAGIGIAYISLFVIKVVFFKTEYDSNAMGGMRNFITLFPDYFSIQSNKNFFRYLISDYYLLVPAIIAVITLYVRDKSYLKLSLSLIFFFGYLLLINVAFQQGAQQLYLEPQYGILSIFPAFPLLYDALPNVKQKWLPILLLTAVLAFCVYRIMDVKSEYSERIAWYRKQLKKTDEKAIVNQEQVPMDLLKFSWGSSYECWLLSTIEMGETRSFIIQEDSNEFDWALNNGNAFLSKWGMFEYNNLNNNYFIFNDYSTYKKIDLMH